MFHRVRIGRRERGFALFSGDLVRYLRPGVHWIRSAYTLERASFETPTLNSPHLKTLLRDPQVQAELTVLDLAQHERAAVWVDGRLHGVWGPTHGGPVAYWNEAGALRVERFDADELELRHPQLDRILAHPRGAAELVPVTVPPGHRGLLYVEQVLRRELAPGRYALWRGVHDTTATVIDQRTQTLDLSGQEVLTADKVTLRINLSATWRVADARGWHEAANDPHAVLYRQLQLGLRRAVGTRTLDEVLQGKQ
ncbi:MAG: SPFH domain-containing protein, partial [Planctomycetota bacterium]